MKTLFKVGLFFLVLLQSSFGENCEELFSKGIQAYQQGNYSAAKNHWESCSIESAELFYHLGNVYYQLDRWGESILHFEKALRLDPAMEDARHNLKIAETKKRDSQESLQIEQEELRWIWNFYNALDLDFLLLVLLGLFLLSLVGFGLIQLGKAKWQKFGYGIVVLALICALPLGVISGWKIYVQERELYGICLSNGVQLRAEPSEKSSSIREINEGTKVEVLLETDRWIQVKLSEEVQGFLRRSDLGLIR